MIKRVLFAIKSFRFLLSSLFVYLAKYNEGSPQIKPYCLKVAKNYFFCKSEWPVEEKDRWRAQPRALLGPLAPASVCTASLGHLGFMWEFVNVGAFRGNNLLSCLPPFSFPCCSESSEFSKVIGDLTIGQQWFQPLLKLRYRIGPIFMYLSF